jgi:transporter family-2 protein
MDRTGVAVLAVVAAGGLVGLQAPVNAGLGRGIGAFPAAAVSFVVGLAALLVIVAVLGQLGNMAKAPSQPWYYLLGGLMGAVYVTTALVTVKTLGAGGITAATIAGQLGASLLIDRLGVFGLAERPITPGRLLGVALLAAGVYFIVRE